MKAAKLVTLLAAVLIAWAALVPASVRAQATITWKVQSVYPAGELIFTENFKRFAEMVEKTSGGRLKIEAIPAGAIVPALEVLDAVHRGVLDGAHSWPGYWIGKNRAAGLYGSVPGGPFGMTYEDYMGWVHLGGGLELYNDLLQKELRLNVVAIPVWGIIPSGLGWFPRAVTSVQDLKRMKVRTAGLAAEILKEMGVTVLVLAGGEILPALERGVIDAAEWADPSRDRVMGFYTVRKFYHIPSMHEATGMHEILVNRKKWDELPRDLQAIVQTAAMATTYRYTLFALHQASLDLEALVSKHGVKVVDMGKEIHLELLKAWDRLADRWSKETPYFAKVLESQRAWAKQVVPYRKKGLPPIEPLLEHYWGQR